LCKSIILGEVQSNDVSAKKRNSLAKTRIILSLAYIHTARLSFSVNKFHQDSGHKELNKTDKNVFRNFSDFISQMA